MYRKPEDLAERVPVFPLNGAILLPRGRLPLNIFEPRYLNMIDDAMASDRLIGMIQPALGEVDRIKPELADVGCVGRITSYAETDDGRYLLVLTGVARFVVRQELQLKLPYRSVRADYTPFKHDFTADTWGQPGVKEGVSGSLAAYLARNDLRADWSELNDADLETFINVLCAACPFSPGEKQALLEAPDLRSRTETLKALLDISARNTDGGEEWMQ
jgi:Lon protease-like protein